MARTNIVGTLTLPDGTPYNGNLSISWGSIPWTADDGTLIPSGPPVTFQIKNGEVDIELQPTDGTTDPTPIYYEALYRPTGSNAIVQYWQVPTSGSPVPLSSVIVPATSNPPVSSGITTLNGLSVPVQLFARTNDTNVTLTITSSSSTHTFAMGWQDTLLAARGGTGGDSSAQTGVPLVTSGTWSYNAAASNLSGWPSGVSMTEVGYLDGVTSAIQTQLDSKASTSALASYLPLAGGTMTGQLVLNPATGAYAADLSKSGSSGTLRVYDQTATTGVTQVAVRAGAGQSSSDLLQLRDASDNLMGKWSNTGAFGWVSSGNYKVQVGGGPALLAASDTTVQFNSATTLASGSVDTGLARASAGVVEVNNGTPGTLRDLKARNLTATGSSSDVTPQASVGNTSGVFVGLGYGPSGGWIQSFGLADLLVNPQGNSVILGATGNIVYVPGTLRIATHTPSSASDTGIAGTIAWDSSFLYVCVSTNAWKRVAISTW